MDMGDVFDLLTSLVALINELRTDHATYKTSVDELKTAVDELIDDHATLKTLTDEVISDFDAHTHNADGSQGGSYFTSIPKTDAATLSGGTTRSIAASALATLAASKPTAGPSTITEPSVSMSGH